MPDWVEMLLEYQRLKEITPYFREKWELGGYLRQTAGKPGKRRKNTASRSTIWFGRLTTCCARPSGGYRRRRARSPALSGGSLCRSNADYRDPPAVYPVGPRAVSKAV